MSYGFEMHFIDRVSELEAFRKARTIAELFAQDDIARKYIDATAIYSPSRRHFLTLSKCEKREADTLQGIITEQFIYNLFNFPFVYWPEHKLLGCCLGSVPAEVEAQFKTSVYFQNSCDQDYPYSDWKKIRLFETIAKECMDYDKDATQNVLGTDWDIEDSVCDLDYFRRTCAYKRIYDMLSLDAWLYGRDDEKFIRFALNTVTSSERKFKLEMMARAIYRLD